MSDIPADWEEMRVEKRNGSIDLMKFVYAWFIVYYHFYFADHAHFIMIIARRKRMFSPPNDTFGGK